MTQSRPTFAKFAAIALTSLMVITIAQPTSAHAAPGTNTSVSSSDAWVQVPQVSTTVVLPNGKLYTLHLDIGMVIDDEIIRQRAIDFAPRVRNALGDSLREYVQHYHVPGAAPDAETMLYLAQEAINTEMNARGKIRVYLTSVFVQRS